MDKADRALKDCSNIPRSVNHKIECVRIVIVQLVQHRGLSGLISRKVDMFIGNIERPEQLYLDFLCGDNNMMAVLTTYMG
ncbi:hypothetical protein CNMCM5623_006424 [Aspergillus felis]|uniref:Uncharacterized protein n=1 Tax=Aspergillus felis TaxID=1287682 RepID=A0A8H6PTL4_9EURO|nr:hypothetical protein CNMCM5623_006424 [Aspergillus felis]